MLGACTVPVRQCASWTTGTTITPAPAGYSDLVGSAGGRVGLLYETGANFPVERIDCTVLGAATIHKADYSGTLELNALDSRCVCPTDTRYLTHRLHGATC